MVYQPEPELNAFLSDSQTADKDIVTLLIRLLEQLEIQNMHLSSLTGEEITAHELTRNRKI